jgi:hypothetical protein
MQAVFHHLHLNDGPIENRKLKVAINLQLDVY